MSGKARSFWCFEISWSQIPHLFVPLTVTWRPYHFHKSRRLAARSLKIQSLADPMELLQGDHSIQQTLLFSQLNFSISGTRLRDTSFHWESLSPPLGVSERATGPQIPNSNQVAKSRILRVPNPHPFYSNPVTHHQWIYTAPLENLSCCCTVLLLSWACSTSPCTELYYIFHHVTAYRFKRLIISTPTLI